MATEAAAREGEGLDPADVLGDREDLDALDAEIARVRAREERRLARLADKAGYFRRRMRNEEILDLFAAAFAEVPKRPSTLARLETRRDLLFSGPRARDARRKALLGAFVVTRCRRRPDVHAALVPDIREFLWSHQQRGRRRKERPGTGGVSGGSRRRGASPPRRRTRGRRGRNGRTGWFSSVPGCWPGGRNSRSCRTWLPRSWQGFWNRAGA